MRQTTERQGAAIHDPAEAENRAREEANRQALAHLTKTGVPHAISVRPARQPGRFVAEGWLKTPHAWIFVGPLEAPTRRAAETMLAEHLLDRMRDRSLIPNEGEADRYMG